METIGKRISEFRNVNKLTQEELANRIGVGQSYLSKIESGKIKPSWNKLEAIAGVLGITLQNLVEDTDFGEHTVFFQGNITSGPIAYCPNIKCPESRYVAINWEDDENRDENAKKLIFLKYTKFPRYYKIEYLSGTPVYHENNHCSFCGTALVKNCECGRDVETEETIYCSSCGKKIFPHEKELEEIVQPHYWYDRSVGMDTGTFRNLYQKYNILYNT